MNGEKNNKVISGSKLTPGGKTLWHWICTRLLSLAIGSTIAIISVMWLRYYIPEKIIMNKIPEAERRELAHLSKNPQENIARYHEIIDKWYGVSYSDPSMDPSDWQLMALLILIAIPVIIFITLHSVRPLSSHISRLAGFARTVSEGSFGERVQSSASLPAELRGLTDDLNLMSGQLERYDKELKASHVALAHELRSPLTASIGRLQGMIDGVFTPTGEQLQMVMKQMLHLNHLVDDLHLLSLADAGHLHLNYQNIAIDEVIKEKVAWLRPGLLSMDFTINLYGDAGVCLTADHFRIGQVISILLDNALRYAAEGKKLDISVGKSAGKASVQVRDYGKGVSDDFLPDIFTRFSRAETSRSRNSGGSGLGLSIAHAICHAHNGSLRVEKNEAGGLTFTLELPLNNPLPSL